MKSAFGVLIAETLRINESDGVELMDDSGLGLIVDDFPFVESFSNYFEKIIE